MASRCWAASRNGSSPATGNSRPRIFAATATTISATVRSIWSALARRAARRDMRERELARRLQVSFYDRGHQTGVYVLPRAQPVPTAYAHSPVVAEYFRECEARRRDRQGEWGRVIGSPGELFP